MCPGCGEGHRMCGGRLTHAGGPGERARSAFLVCLEKVSGSEERNKAYLVHYEERAKEQKTYTSQVAESHIESIINARHNKSGKMQWTRAGAHKVLQIRGVITSNEWEDRWQGAVLSALEVVA